jgi:hypothetical protein
VAVLEFSGNQGIANNPINVHRRQIQQHQLSFEFFFLRNASTCWSAVVVMNNDSASGAQLLQDFLRKQMAL